ncbi:MAG: lysylphosphatidylglycerol synthase transmembrane domain-containing protein [Ignavibacteriales bacterium]
MNDRDDVRRIKERGTRRSVIVSLAVSLAALFLVFLYVPDRSRAFDSIRTFDRGKLAVCALIMSAAWVADSFRLYLMTRGVGKPVGLFVAIKAILAGNFLTLITPFLAGGAPIVVYTVKQGGMNWGGATAVVVGGGIVAQAALVFLAVGSMATLHRLQVTVRWGGVFQWVVPAYACGLLVFSALALRADVVETWLRGLMRNRKRTRLVALGRKFIRDLKDFRKSLSMLASENLLHVAGAFACALVYFILFFAIGPVVLSGLGVNYPWMTVFALEVLVYVLSGITPTPGGSGTAELGTFVLLSQVAPTHTIGAFLVVWRLLTFYLSLLTGGIAFTAVLRDILSDR